MNVKSFRKIFYHAIFWVIFFSLPFLLRPDFPHNTSERFAPPSQLPFIYVATCLMVVILFYFNVNHVFATTVKQKLYIKLALYQALILCTIALFFKLMLYITDVKDGIPLGFPLMLYLVTTIIAFSYHIFNDKVNTEKELAEKEKEYLKAELQFLRWQISPHFLFNVLNNVAALARLRSDQVEPTIIKLSSLMRYMLYDLGDKKNSIKDEVEYIRNYISLQALRFGNRVDIKFTLDVDESLTFYIEPMLLIPFVENAFKHGTQNVTDPFIKVFLSLKRTNTKHSALFVEIVNRFDDTYKNEDTLGIGMLNVKRRINLLYGSDASLEVVSSNRIYTVSLCILNRQS